MNELKMDQLSKEQRALIVGAYGVDESVMGELARRLATLPMSPHDLSHLVNVAPMYLPKIGQRIIMLDDVENGTDSSLMISADQSAVIIKENDGMLPVANNELESFLNKWDSNLVGAGFVVVSSDEMIEFLADVDSALLS